MPLFTDRETEIEQVQLLAHGPAAIKRLSRFPFRELCSEASGGLVANSQIALQSEHWY